MTKKAQKIKNTKADEGQWYLIRDGWFQHECCGCGLRHKIEVGLAWREKFENSPKSKVAIRWFGLDKLPLS